jgi:hypothetical protein
MRVAALVTLVCVAAGVLYSAQAQQGTVLSAQIVDVYQPSNGLDRGVHYSVAKVKVVDQAGSHVWHAVVSGTFTQCDQTFIASARTGSDGFAYLRGPRFVWCCAKSFTVTSVTKTGATWDRVQDTVSWPNPCN